MSTAPEHTNETNMTFFDHLDALRPHLTRAVVAFLVVSIAAFALGKEYIIDGILFAPSRPDFITLRGISALMKVLGMGSGEFGTAQFAVVSTRMAGQFNLHLAVSMAVGLVVSVPYLLWELWCFVRPGLTPAERRGSRFFVARVSICFFGGLAFGYFLIAPLTIRFLAGYSASDSIVNMIDATSYLSTVVTVSLSCAAVFQLPLLIHLLSRMGIVNSRTLKKFRKHSIVLMFLFAAIITPPDLVSQFLVALPLAALYEMSIKIAKKNEKRRKRESGQDVSVSSTTSLAGGE